MLKPAEHSLQMTIIFGDIGQINTYISAKYAVVREVKKNLNYFHQAGSISLFSITHLKKKKKIDN